MKERKKVKREKGEKQEEERIKWTNSRKTWGRKEERKQGKKEERKKLREEERKKGRN